MHAANGHTVMQVLLVEDNPGDAFLIQEAFQASGADCQIAVARDGEVALAMLNGAGNEPVVSRPDLILLDLNLPKMSGHEVLKELKTRDEWRPIPVIVLTSSRAERDVSTAYDRHCNAYFCKPPSFGENVQLIRLIADFWQKAEWYRPVTILPGLVEQCSTSCCDSTKLHSSTGRSYLTRPSHRVKSVHETDSHAALSQPEMS
jgi:CheY-like chemotaxis protein